MIARVRAARRDDTGVSLIELMVSSVILIVVLGLLTSAMITGFKGATGAGDRTTNAETGAVALNRITKELRQAIILNDNATAAFTAASSNSVTFTTNYFAANSAGAIVRGPTAVTLALGNNANCVSPDYCLIESTTPTTTTQTFTVNGSPVQEWAAGTVTTTRVLLHHVSNTASQKLFQFYKTINPSTGGRCYDSDPSCVRTLTAIPVDGSGNVSAANLQYIDTVDVYVGVSGATYSKAPGITLQSRVSMPNVYVASAPVTS